VRAAGKDEWDFREVVGDWAWHVSRGKGGQQRSARTFATLQDCIEDAKRFGYCKPERTQSRQLSRGCY
jgi:hypothetical protein